MPDGINAPLGRGEKGSERYLPESSLPESEEYDMEILQWIHANWDLIFICLGVLVNAAGLVYNICKFCRSGKAKSTADWIRILEAAREYEVEAEGFPDYSAAEKLQYVLSRLRTVTAELGVAFDEEGLTAQIEADIAFSKAVNACKSERLE